MATPDKFVVDLSAFVKKAKGNMDKVVRKVVIDIGTRIVMRSPVGDGTLWKNPPPKGYIGGRFRANWQYGEAVRPKGTRPDIDRSGAVSLRRIAKIAPQASGKVHYITNNLPYAMRLETGWSKQAPGGMVGLAVKEFAAIVAKAAKEETKR
jgi:hypothetical protein